MIMPPRLRRIALTTHIACSVGWLGAVAGFLVLNIAGLASHNVEVVRGAYLSMNLIGLYIIVPLSLAALTTGLIQSLGTEWGLFRYYWVLTKLTLTIGATGLLMVHQFGAVEKAARRVLALAPGTLPEMHGLGIELVSKAGLAVVALIAITALSIFKPWGLTRYGQLKLKGAYNPSDSNDWRRNHACEVCRSNVCGRDALWLRLLCGVRRWLLSAARARRGCGPVP